MKNSSRGNYRVLYRDLEPDVLHNHFSIVACQNALLEREGLEEKKALKAVREMARVHFSELEPDGFLGNKKAWYGRRWTALYSRWGDYLSERDHVVAPMDPPLHKEPVRDQQSKSWINRVKPHFGLLRNIAALVLIFMSGYLFRQTEKDEPELEASSAHSVQGMLVDEDLDILRERVLTGNEETNLLYFPNLEGTLAVFAAGDRAFAVIDDRWVRVGDHIVLDDTRGRVTEIHPSRMTLKNDAGFWQVNFPELVVMSQPTFSEGQVVVYPERGNLVTILNAMAKVNNWKLVGSPVNHNISGRFTSEADFVAACKRLGVRFEENLIDLSGAFQPGSYISFGGLWHQPHGTLDEIIGFYKAHLPYDVQVDGVLPTERWVINYGLQFQEFCEHFELETEIRGDMLIVKGGNDENG